MKVIASIFVLALATSVFAAPAPKHHLNAVPGEYIVVLKADADVRKINTHFQWLNSAVMTFNAQMAQSSGDSSTIQQFNGIKNTYAFEGFMGYNANIPDDIVAKMKNDPLVESIEPNHILQLDTIDEDIYSNDDNEDFVSSDNSCYAGNNQAQTWLGIKKYKVTQKNTAPWNLARLSSRTSLKGKSIELSNYNYTYFDKAGAGVDVYVLDTGINVEHCEFGGRATKGESMIADEGNEDGTGHGTHCAGTVAGSRYGVAKNANIISVKVLNSRGSGTADQSIRGIEWVVQQAKITKRPSVVNYSVGGPLHDGTTKAFDAAHRAGISIAAAAGNSDKDACIGSPSDSKVIIIVGSSTINDTRSSFSNWGKCVTLFAPGSRITSASKHDNTKTTIKSGTSMASPLVAGQLAILRSLHPKKDTDAIKRLLILQSKKLALKDVKKGSPNRLLYNRV